MGTGPIWCLPSGVPCQVQGLPRDDALSQVAYCTSSLAGRCSLLKVVCTAITFVGARSSLWFGNIVSTSKTNKPVEIHRQGVVDQLAYREVLAEGG